MSHNKRAKKSGFEPAIPTPTKDTFSFLNNSFDIKLSDIKKHIFYLIILSIVIKIIFVLASIFVFHIVIDYYDLKLYMTRVIPLFNGGTPYITYSLEYSVLSLIPMIISGIISFGLNDMRTFPIVFQFLMMVCDIITVICIYFISLKIYNNIKTAYISGLIYIISLCAIYTAITRFDSLSVCLLMISILLVIYNETVKGYGINIISFFVKIFPIVALPFFILYKKSVLKELKIVIPIGIMAFCMLIVPFIVVSNISNALKPYLFASGSTIPIIYAGTLTNTIYNWIYYILHINISIDIISNILYIITGIVICYLFYYAYKLKEQTPRQLVTFICIALCGLILCVKFHSPQYFMWVTPLFAILVADNINKIIVYFVLQILSIIEFPVIFGSLYTNTQYVGEPGSYAWGLALFFFTLQYIMILVLLKMSVGVNLKFQLSKVLNIFKFNHI